MDVPRSAGRVPTPELRAFEVLVREHHRRLLAYAAALTRRAEQAEDLVQEAFVTAWRRLGDFDTSADFGAWLRGIIRMKHREALRRRQEQPIEESVLESVERIHAGWERAAGESGVDIFAALRECLDRLADAAREAVSLFYLARLPCADVAQRTGTNEITVRKRLQRAREDLARCVRGKLDAEAPGGEA
jgi:RNA polymerase sigma-70 factor (ECF subfamily)